MAALIVGRAAQVRSVWPDGRYDLAWIFEPEATNHRFGVRQVPQMLLAGDGAGPIR